MPLSVRRLAHVLVTAVLVALAGMSVAGPAAADAPSAPVPPVVLVGVGGLQWSDVDRSATPTLWRMVGEGSVGSISVHTARPVSCPLDAWLTVSAGRRVAVAADGPGSDDGSAGTDDEPANVDGCAPLPTIGGASSALGTPLPATVRGWKGLTDQGPEALGVPGTVGQRIDDVPACSTGAGPGAAIALADERGHLDRYVDDAATLPAPQVTECPVTVVDAGELPAARTERAQALTTLDDELRRLTSQVAAGTRVLVAGVSDSASGEAGLQAVVEWERGGGQVGWLSSGSTRYPGIVTLADLGATLAQAAGASTADLDGSPVVVDSERRMSADRTVENRRYLVQMTTITPKVMPLVLGVAGAAVAVALGVVLVARRRDALLAPAARRAVLAVLLLGASTPVGAHLAALSRWWGSPAPLFAAIAWYALAAVVVALVIWLVSRLLPRGRWTLAGAAAGITWLVLTVDGVTGTVLQQGSILGVTPTLGARYYGFGNTTFGIYAASALVLAGAVAAWLIRLGRRRGALAAVVALGAVSVVVDGWPTFGADFGGVLALVPAFAVLALAVAGVRVTPRRALLVAALALLAVALVAVVDWARPGRSSHLGLFVQHVLDGDSWAILSGKARGAWSTVDAPLGALAALACIAVCVLLVGPDRWRPALVRRAYAAWPVLRPVLLAVVVVAVLGSLLNDSGVVVAVAVLGVAGTMLVLSALGHAWEGLPAGVRDLDSPVRRMPAVVVATGGALLAVLLVGSVLLPTAPVAGGVTSGVGAAAVPDDRPVVVVGTGGLTWADVDRTTTPTLWSLLRDGAAAGGVAPGVTGAPASCDAGGWLSLSAGVAPVTGERVDGTWVCAPWHVTLGDGTAQVDGWSRLVALQSRSEYHPVLGTLGATFADGGVCATAVGADAALALAGPDGSVPRYRTVDQAVAEPADAFSCPVTFVDAGDAPHARGIDDATRATMLAELDDQLRRILQAVPASSTVMVVDTGNPASARAALGVGLLDSDELDGATFLSTPSTRWVGVVRLLDLPSTVLTAVGLPTPDVFTGSPMTVGVDRPADSATTVRQLADLTTRDQALRGTSGRVTTTPMLVSLVLVVLASLVVPPLARRLPRTGATLRRVLDALQVFLLALPAGVFLMTTTSWWRFSSPTTVMWVAVVGCTLLVTGLALLLPWRPVWGAAGATGLVTFALLTLDAVLGTPLHRGSLLGPAPTLGGRFYGFGNPTYSVYVVGALLAACVVGTALRRWRWLAAGAAAAICGVALVVDLFPSLGADVGGGLVLLPAGAIVVLAVAGIRVTWVRLGLAAVAGVLLVAAIGYLDWRRPSAERTHLGIFVQSVVDGTAWQTISRKLDYALRTVNAGWASWLTMALLVVGVLLVWRAAWVRWRDWDALVGRWPLVHPLVLALLVAAVGGSVVNDYGIKIATGVLAAWLPAMGSLLLRAGPVDEPLPGSAAVRQYREGP
ncbi:hypothetical protein [Cellulomonas sp. HZM]|uniref:hypothetical protein n=1 Tax=Cellulomonas sp. HZM TaxID=1454010 RepID=UPI0012DCB38F|nr:hypothetical protein [Cellulomonas sp. HZM]